MSASATEFVDTSTMSLEDLYEAMWLSGDLRPLMHAGQVALCDKIQVWSKIDQTNDIEHIAGSMPRVFAVAAARRFRKTSAMLLIASMIAQEFATRPTPFSVEGQGCWIRYTSAYQKSIEEIIGTVEPKVFETAPESCRPKYFGKRGPLPAGLYFPKYGPMMGARIALAGLDENPNALRGQSSDFDFISEAAFVRRLIYAIRDVIYQQYQGRAYARMILESTAPEILYTDWEREILPDAKRRGAIFEATIDDNPALSPAERSEFIAAAGGRGHPTCEREYYNVIAGDPTKQVFPEFSKTAHVRSVPIPRHAMAITIADPGQVHQFALLFAVLDFDNNLLIIQDSWSESNAGSMKVAAVVAAREFDLWGTWPHPRFDRMRLESDEKSLGWRELLKGDRCASLADELHRMAQTPVEKRPDFESYPGKWVTNDLPERLSYWDPDKHEHRSNPAVRVSDIDKQLIRDIDDHYGLEFMATTKVELVTMSRNARNWLGEGRVVFQPDAGPVIEHVHAALWPDKQRRTFDEHPVYGHFDLAAAYVYLCRKADDLTQKRPHPPPDIALVVPPGIDAQSRLPWKPKAPHQIAAEHRLQVARGREPGRIRGWND